MDIEFIAQYFVVLIYYFGVVLAFYHSCRSLLFCLFHLISV